MYHTQSDILHDNLKNWYLYSYWNKN